METMTIGQAISGMSMALFAAVTVLLLVALSALASMGIVLAFQRSAQMLLKAIKETAARTRKAQVDEPKPARAKVARIGG